MSPRRRDDRCVQTAPPASARRVLVVEDETLMRWSLVEMLTLNGYDVVDVEDAAAARRVLGDTVAAIDVVLLDLWLPDSRDLGLLADIRRLSPQSAVVLMSVDCPPETIEAARALGVSTILPKPFDLWEIGRIVAAATAQGAAH